MKTGEDFWNSKEERYFDYVIGAAATPAFWAGKKIMRRYVPRDLSVLFEQVRADMGDPDDPPEVLVIKFQTLWPGTETPINHACRRARKYTLDELGQIPNIRQGSLTTAGPRAILLRHHHDRRAAVRRLEIEDPVHARPGLSNDWDYVLENHKRGWLSSYALWQHSHSTAPYEEALNAEMDVEDAAKDSIAYRAKLFGAFINLAVERRFR